jgi:hypothetical protein
VRASVEARPVFSVGGETFSWADVVEAARRYGSWQELEDWSRQALACVGRLAASGERLDPRDVLEAAKRFRYARRLLAGDELEEWLDRWDVSETEWRDHLRRALLRERWPGELADTVQRFPVSEGELEPVLWPDAVCSGLLEQAAHRLAAERALAAEGAAAGAVEEHELEHEIALHRLEWLRIEGELLTVRSLDAAREAALCVREDGRPLADVAADAGTSTTQLRVYADDLESELSTALVGALAGELVGPVPHGEGYALVLVASKTPPSAADPEIRRRAEARIGGRAVAHALREHVEWHDRL